MTLTLVACTCLFNFIVSADFEDLRDLYELKESHVEHRSEGLKSDYYDPLKDGNRESNRQ